jgi:hypothetical protein
MFCNIVVEGVCEQIIQDIGHEPRLLVSAATDFLVVDRNTTYGLALSGCKPKEPARVSHLVYYDNHK